MSNEHGTLGRRGPARRSAALRAVVLALVLVSLMVGSSAAAPEQTIDAVYTSNVTGVAFVVTWTTDTPANGSVEWGPTAALGKTAADQVPTSSTVHYVQVTGLAPGVTYHFRVRSGGAVRDNGGVPFTVRTTSTDATPAPKCLIWGTVTDPNGAKVPNVVAYVQIRDANDRGSPGESAWISALTDANGTWFQDLGNVYTQDGTDYFDYTPGADELRLVWEGGAKGASGSRQGAGAIQHPVPLTCPARFDVHLKADAAPVTLSSLAAQAGSLVVVVALVLGGVLAVAGFVVLRRRR